MDTLSKGSTMKRFGVGVLIGLLLASLFSAPWMLQSVYAVGNCASFRSWNTGDSVTAGDLNSSFTTAAVTNSTPQCLDDYSLTVAQMQTTTDPYASGTESLATSTAGELERLRFMFKQIFGLTNWYRHDQSPTFSFSHMNASALHLGSTGVAGGTDTVQNQFLSRFPVLTGPNHWTGIWWPHNTTHMAISIADANHATGGVQGGIELFRFHARGLIFHHTVALMFKHSESQMHGGQRGHVTAIQVNQLDQIVVGHSGSALILHGAGMVQGPNRLIALSPNGEFLTARHIIGSGGVTISHTATTLTIDVPAAAAAGSLSSLHIFTSSGTWTRPSGVLRVVIEVVGGGGGGGALAAPAAGVSTGAGGGGGGGAGIAFVNVTSISSATITIGAGGAGGVAGANPGSAGSNSVWSDGTNTITGLGGSGGGAGGAAGGAGGLSTGATFTIRGSGGGPGGTSSAGVVLAGIGGGSRVGGSSLTATGAAGPAAAAYSGAGGSGGHDSTEVARAGGAGGSGMVIVYEYK